VRSGSERTPLRGSVAILSGWRAAGVAGSTLSRVAPPGDVTRQLEAIERERLRALVEPDIELARSLHAEDYQLVTPGGKLLSGHEYLDQIASGELDYRVFEPEGEMVVRSWGDAAALRYRVRIAVAFDGQQDADSFWHTDIYELRDERWQAVWSHATRIR
jgi:hypothetical protein